VPDTSLFGFDTEYAPDGEILTVGIGGLSQAVAVEPADAEFYDVLGEIANAEEAAALVGHSVSGDVDQLVSLGLARPDWVTGKRTRDSLLLARLKDENRGKGGYDLESLLCSENNVEPWKQDTVIYSKTDATKWPVDLRKERCRLDAWASLQLAAKYAGDTEIQGMPLSLIHQIALSLHRIRHAGVFIDKAKLDKLEYELQTTREIARDKLTKLAQGYGVTEFNPTNDSDIRDLLFKRMGLAVTKKTRKEKLPAVDQVTLKQYADKPEVKLLLEFNKADKAYSTNVEGVKKLVQPGNIPGKDLYYLPVNINPLGARTGRRSSERPNMQNWPVPMRQMVVSRFPGGIILENDYKSLEVFLLAYEAQDYKLDDFFRNRGGYIAIAKELWGMDVKKGSPEYKATKSVVLGTNYNMQTPLMAENLWNAVGVRFSSDYKEHEKQTDKLRRGYLKLFPGIPKYMDRQESFLL
jgi:DNA polymerase I-like protein with 3'-5' exonuclease and polymerase domains